MKNSVEELQEEPQSQIISNQWYQEEMQQPWQTVYKPQTKEKQSNQLSLFQQVDHIARQNYITKTYLYNSDPLKPNFYTVKLGFTGVKIIFLNPA